MLYGLFVCLEGIRLSLQDLWVWFLPGDHSGAQASGVHGPHQPTGELHITAGPRLPICLLQVDRRLHNVGCAHRFA